MKSANRVVTTAFLSAIQITLLHFYPQLIVTLSLDFQNIHANLFMVRKSTTSLCMTVKFFVQW